MHLEASCMRPVHMGQRGQHLAHAAQPDVLSCSTMPLPNLSVAQVGIGCTLALAGGSPNAAWIALFFICSYICGYADSWGPLPWLYVAEV